MHSAQSAATRHRRFCIPARTSALFNRLRLLSSTQMSLHCLSAPLSPGYSQVKSSACVSRVDSAPWTVACPSSSVRIFPVRILGGCHFLLRDLSNPRIKLTSLPCRLGLYHPKPPGSPSILIQMCP